MDNRQIIFKNHPVKSSEKLMRDFPAKVCYTNDKLTAQLVFEISDCTEAELAGLTASIMIFMKDGSFFQDSAVIDAPNKKITYVMLENQVAHAGDARASLALTGGSKGWGGPDRNFTVISDLGQRVATEVMIKDWTMLTAEARAYLDDAQAAEAARAATFGQWSDTQADWAAAEAARVNDFSSKADKTTTVNGKALSANISLTATDVPNTPAGGIAATTVQEAVNELDTEKANKAQEEWKTPTLLNGATGTVQYRKNQFGNVEFRGNLTAKEGSAAMSLPVGYRPSADVHTISGVSGTGTTVVRRIFIQPSGSFYVHQPFGTYDVCMNGVEIHI